VREALRQAAGAFGPAGREVTLASPATPEAVYWAVQAARDATAARRVAGPVPVYAEA
jgi:xanthine dehydrogenase large subunit